MNPFCVRSPKNFSFCISHPNRSYIFISDEGPMLETLDYTIRIGSTPTILYFDS